MNRECHRGAEFKEINCFCIPLDLPEESRSGQVASTVARNFSCPRSFCHVLQRAGGGHRFNIRSTGTTQPTYQCNTSTSRETISSEGMQPTCAKEHRRVLGTQSQPSMMSLESPQEASRLLTVHMDLPERETLSIPRISFIIEARLRAAVEELVHPKHVILAHTQGLLGGVRSKGASVLQCVLLIASFFWAPRLFASLCHCPRIFLKSGLHFLPCFAKPPTFVTLRIAGQEAFLAVRAPCRHTNTTTMAC